MSPDEIPVAVAIPAALALWGLLLVHPIRHYWKNRR